MKVKVTQSCPALCDPWTVESTEFFSQNTGVGSLFLLQGIFPTQGLNPGLLHCRRILFQLSHKRSARILEWLAYPFSRVLPNPGIEPGSPAFQVDSLPTELSGFNIVRNCKIVFQNACSVFFFVNTCSSFIFNFCHSNRNLMVLIFVILIFMFPMMSDLEHLFICLFCLLYVSNECSNFCPFKRYGFCFLIIEF